MFLSAFHDELVKLAQRVPADIPIGKDPIKTEGTVNAPADELVYKDRTISRTAKGWRLFHLKERVRKMRQQQRQQHKQRTRYRRYQPTLKQGPSEEHSTLPKPKGYEQDYRRRGIKPPKYIQHPKTPRGMGTPKEWAEYHKVKAKMPATDEETRRATYKPPMSSKSLPRLRGSLKGEGPASRLSSKLPKLKKPDVSKAPPPKPLRVEQPRSTFERYQRSSYSSDRQPWESP